MSQRLSVRYWAQAVMFVSASLGFAPSCAVSLRPHLTPAPNVASVKTSLTIRTAKAVPGIPVRTE